ncbi:hypothetical protein JTB14_030340 [Gonioctena quinquepunctata]|nr:hypothetical protein JTB14_030340 [Gonioctena quinquepunctata]
MGKLIAVTLALLVTCSGQQIFRETTIFESGSVVSMCIFMTALFLLLYDLRLFPSSLRKLDGLGQIFIEFLVAVFLIENIMMDFWIPLLATTTQEVSPAIADLLDEKLRERDWNCFEFCDFLRTVLHAIRAIDLRALQEGPDCFIGDIYFRTKRFFRRKLKSLGFGGRKRVKIRENADFNRKSEYKRNNHKKGLSSDDDCLDGDSQYQENCNMDDDGTYSEFDMASDF